MPRVGSKARTRARKLAASQLDGVNGDDVADRICGTIAAAIAEGALRPGNKILEDVLADHFRVSRTVVRGALGILQREHLLERRRNHGTFVAEPSIKEATQLFEARRALERLVLEYVMLRARPEDLDRLERLVDEELRIHRSGDETEKTKLSGKFHVELSRLARNEVMTEMLEKLVARISLVMAHYEDELHDDCGAEDHRAILAALRDGHLGAAQELMAEHLADLEGRVQLTEGMGERDNFALVLETFSAR